MSNSPYYATSIMGCTAGQVFYCWANHCPWDWTRTIFSYGLTLLVMFWLRDVLNPKKIKQ
jgi:hypothetical protein